MIHSLAVVHPEAKIAEGVEIGPFVTIEKNVEIGKGTQILSGATILEGSRIGENCRIFPGAVIGAIPQDLKFKGEESLAIIGNNTTIRECATVNRGTASKGKTVVGDNCLLMAYVHIGHDCHIKNNIIMSNAVQVAGEVIVDDHVVIGGGTLIHQFTRIGEHVMVQGGSKINKDIPPYVMAAREPICYVGLNSVGLRRRGFSNELINQIQDCYRLLYLSKLNNSAALEEIEKTIPQSTERDYILEFIKTSERGIIKGH